MSAQVHPTAFVSPKAELGNNVIIGHCACVDDNVIIGDGTEVQAFASVKSYTRIGKNNTIHSYALVGGIPQDLKFAGEVSWLEIGDNNTIREFSSIHRGSEGGGGLTSIGNNNLLMAYTHVAHDCHLASGIVMSNAATLAGHVEVQDGAIIGGLSAVHQFVRIGKKAFVGGMTGIAQDLPPYMLAVGERAGIHGPNLVALRRMKMEKETISAIRNVFKMIWLSGLPRQEALEQLESKHADIPEAMEIVMFVRESQRGVLSAERGADIDS